MCLMKVQRVKYLNGALRKSIMLIFLRLKIFCQIFLNKILTLVLAIKIEEKLIKIISSQVGASNFISNIQSHVVMDCKLCFF
jgi:hypothetical protein